MTIECRFERTLLPHHRFSTFSNFFFVGRFHTWPGGNLTLIDLEPSDSGVFECVVRSAVMTLMASTRLLVEIGMRIQPYELNILNTTWHSVTIEWKPAYHPGLHLKHVIWQVTFTNDMTWVSLQSHLRRIFLYNYLIIHLQNSD